MAGMLAVPFRANALMLVVGDSHYLGSVEEGNPSNPTAQQTYISQLISMATPSGPTAIDYGMPIGIQTFNRSANVFGSLPAPLEALKTENPPLNPWTLPGGYVYLLAKYGNATGGPGQISYVWVIEGLGTEFSVDAQGLSHMSVFNRSTDHRMPDGGATVALFGGGLAVLGLLRRRLIA